MGRTPARTVDLGIDLAASVVGFGSAQHVTGAHRRIMRRLASPLLGGPPPSEDLLEIVLHLFTEEEAELVQHLPIFVPRTAEGVARRAGLTPAAAQVVLDRLAFTKRVILAAGQRRRYGILPLVPGIFELCLMTSDLSTRNAWHQRFAELFERLWDQGFIVDYMTSSRAPVRYLPVGAVAGRLHQAWPSDRLEEILAPYDRFAVGHCQCRLAMHLVGRGCAAPLENCTGMGPTSDHFIERGLMREVDRDEVIALKRQAEEAGCVTWMMNVHDDPRGNGSCSCCGCCCHALRSISQFSAPGMFSQPHFLPARDAATCTSCRQCVAACPMGAWVERDGELWHERIRCIGCGLCVVACPADSLRLEPAPEAPTPEATWPALLAKMAPRYVSNAIRIWSKRLFATAADPAPGARPARRRRGS
jgi:Pyruvate/2-oxoacid:ferredoxin oxidoreductase delta subunit